MTTAELERRLAQRTLALINIPSVSRSEAAILTHLERATAPLSAFRSIAIPGHGLLLWPAARASRPLVLLVGHVDTVPEQGNLPGRDEGGWIHGLGASDMKGGL
ncbi:MAG: M20/M25/M40 family metallo-hydrolase, partial [Chloroflexota bacterium]